MGMNNKRLDPKLATLTRLEYQKIVCYDDLCIFASRNSRQVNLNVFILKQ